MSRHDSIPEPWFSFLHLDLLRERYQTEHRPYLGNPKREDLTLQLWIEAITEDRVKQKT
jgi:hypothetical protein